MLDVVNNVRWYLSDILDVFVNVKKMVNKSNAVEEGVTRNV